MCIQLCIVLIQRVILFPFVAKEDVTFYTVAYLDLAKLISKSCRMLPCHYLICFGKLDDVNSTSQDSINHELFS